MPDQTTKPPCSVEGCSRESKARGWCLMHYKRWHHHGTTERAYRGPTGRNLVTRTCTVEGCGGIHVARGYCGKHLLRVRKYGSPHIVLPRPGRTGPRPTIPPEVRFWAKVEKTDSCWLWRAYTRNGYGVFHPTNYEKSEGAHRYAYQLLIGPIPEGLQIDHLCFVRNCVNPAHLEPVTPQENSRRKPSTNPTHCPAGHAYDEANTYVDSGNGKHCRICRRQHAQTWRLNHVKQPPAVGRSSQ